MWRCKDCHVVPDCHAPWSAPWVSLGRAVVWARETFSTLATPGICRACDSIVDLPLVYAAAILPFAEVPLHVLSYVLLSIWIVVNARVLPVALLGLGAVCNFSVLIANGGLMPASSRALQQAGLDSLANHLMQEGSYANLISMSPSTHLNFLGDILYLPKWIPFSVAFSIGDLLIWLALIWLIVKGMRIYDKRPVRAT